MSGRFKPLQSETKAKKEEQGNNYLKAVSFQENPPSSWN
jgi:hypothetical protein